MFLHQHYSIIIFTNRIFKIKLNIFNFMWNENNNVINIVQVFIDNLKEKLI